MSIIPAPLPNGKHGSPEDGPRDGWLAKPVCGWGLLVIGKTIYSVHEVDYEESDGTPRMAVRLRKADGTEYQITPTPDGPVCDCPDQTYRGEQPGMRVDPGAQRPVRPHRIEQPPPEAAHADPRRACRAVTTWP